MKSCRYLVGEQNNKVAVASLYENNINGKGEDSPPLLEV
jgi:hypothetical protein